MSSQPSETNSLRIYYWVPKNEVAYIQSIIDSHEGICRVRTERQTETKTLLLFLTPEVRKNHLIELIEALRIEGILIEEPV